jgi:hypothetical protein
VVLGSEVQVLAEPVAPVRHHDVRAGGRGGRGRRDLKMFYKFTVSFSNRTRKGLNSLGSGQARTLYIRLGLFQAWAVI